MGSGAGGPLPTAPDEAVHERLADRRVLFAAAVLALLLRFLTFPGLTREDLRLVSMDDYGHLRRAVAILHDAPHLPVFDPYLNHPHGAIWIWPPLFDLLIAVPAGLVFGLEAEVEEVALVAALLPPLLGVLSLLPLFAFVRRTLGQSEAHLAVGLYAVLPAAVTWSSFGHADQHAGEALALLLVLAAGARVLGPRGRSHGPVWLQDRRGLALLALAVAAGVLTWQGAIFVAPVLAAAALLSGRGREVSLSLFAAGLVVLPVAFWHPGPTTYVSFGIFQPIFLGLVAGLLLLATVPRWGIPLAVGTGLVTVFVWPPLANGVRHLLSATSGVEMVGGGYLAYPSAWLQLIAEYRPLLQGGPGRALSQLSGGVLLLPLAVAVWCHGAWRRLEKRGPWLLLVFSSLVITAMTLSQRRYVYYLVVLVAVILAAAAAELRRRWGWLAALGLILVALLPTATALHRLPRVQGAAGSDVFLTLRRLATLDPPPHDSFHPSQVRPGQIAGVLAPWSLGHLINLFVQRPTVADTFGYGFFRQSQVFTAPPEQDSEVHRWLLEWNCRYLLTTDLRPILPLYARAVEKSEVPMDRMLAVRVHQSPERQPLPFLTLVLTSQTGWLDREGRWIPRLKVFRVEPGPVQETTADPVPP